VPVHPVYGLKFRKLLHARAAPGGPEIHRHHSFAEAYGLEKSAISERFIQASREKFKTLMERPLGELRLCAIVIDGTPFKSRQMIAAIGVAHDGKKTVLGLREGATENAAAMARRRHRPPDGTPGQKVGILKCREARNRQKVHCGGNRKTCKMPTSIGSRAKNRKWFSREKPTYSANTMANTNWYIVMHRVARFTFSVSSTTCWNSNFSSIVATGSRPP
jgi:hypothetical protein